QDRRIGRGDDFDLLERAGERRTLADDLGEIELTLNLFFQVDLFAGQFVLQRFDLFEGQRVFDRDGDLTGDLAEQFRVFRVKCVVPQATHRHYSQRAVVRNQRSNEAGFDFDSCDPRGKFGLKALPVYEIDDDRFTIGDRPLPGGFRDRHDLVFFQISPAAR